MLNRFTSLLIIVALCLNYPQSNHQLSKLSAGALSDASFNIRPDPAQSETGQNPQAQDQPSQDQTIRVKTELINLRAVVTDKRGQPITDLRTEDFELTENGKPRYSVADL